MAAKRVDDADTAMEAAAPAQGGIQWEIIAVMLTTLCLLVAFFCVVQAAGPYGGIMGE